MIEGRSVSTDNVKRTKENDLMIDDSKRLPNLKDSHKFLRQREITLSLSRLQLSEGIHIF